eukprot:1185784-Prorocentrum_minimum.AAC.4
MGLAASSQDAWESNGGGAFTRKPPPGTHPRIRRTLMAMISHTPTCALEGGHVPRPRFFHAKLPVTNTLSIALPTVRIIVCHQHR